MLWTKPDSTGSAAPSDLVRMSFGTIYTHNPNPRTTAILAVAKAHGLKLDVVYADKDKNPDNYQKLLEINPLGQVPVFVGADGYVLTECIAITLYITSQSETSTLGLLGANKREYHSILKWMSLINSDMLPAIGGVILPLMGRKLDVRLDRDDCLRVFYRDCQVLEDHLQKHKYLVGDKITLADYFTVGMIVFAVMVFHTVLKEKYPRLMAWFMEVYEMPLLKEVAGPLHLLNIPIPGASN